MESKLMNTSEPTTGEIVRALNEIVDCAWDAFAYGGISTRVPTAMKTVIDAKRRLESQERATDELEDECGKLRMSIGLLTARAEQAEQERDAAVNAITRSCCLCANGTGVEVDAFPCCICHKYDKWTWRGLPQEGEGK